MSMEREKTTPDRGLVTHVALHVEPDPNAPLMLKYEMNDDGCQSPGYTLARAIKAAYPSGIVELLLLDLIEHVVLSDCYEEAVKFIDHAQVQGADKLRAQMVALASYWRRNRERFYEAHSSRPKDS